MVSKGSVIVELLEALAELLIQLFIELIGYVVRICVELPFEALSSLSQNQDDK
jgi:hypothetical protein